MIPPAVIEIRGDDRSLLDTVAEVKAVLRDLASNVTNVPIGGDLARLVTAIADAKALQTTWAADQTNAPLGADDARLVTGLAGAKALIDTWAKTPTLLDLGVDQGHLTGSLAASKALLDTFAKTSYNLDIGIDGTPAITEMTALHGTLATMGVISVDPLVSATAVTAAIEELRNTVGLPIIPSVDPTVAAAEYALAKTELDVLAHPIDVDVMLNEASLAVVESQLALLKSQGVLNAGAPGLLSSLGGRVTAAGDNGLSEMLYGGEKGSFMSKLLSPLTMLSTLFSAKFGSLGSLAGFGTEHLAITAGSLAGLGLAGGAGAGLLGMGALGKSLVGGGSDSLVSHEVLANISALNQGTTTYDALVKKVGVDGAQAATQLAGAWNQTKTAFDELTGPAQLAFSKISQGALKVADSYLPLIASAAEKNFGIIGKAIQPLEKWFSSSGPLNGKGIFASLESGFSAGLGTDVKALSAALEHLLRVVDIAAPLTGSFIKAWGDKEAWYGSASGIEKTSSTISRLVGDFKTVDAFLRILGKDLVDVFHNDAGTATAILKELTKGLQSLGKWINSVGGSQELKELFNVHKGETLTLVKSLGELLESFGKTYLKIAPSMVTLATDVLKLANAFFELTQKVPVLGPIVAMGTALFIMEERSKTLTSGLKLLKDGFSVLGTAANLGQLAFLKVEGGITKLRIAIGSVDFELMFAKAHAVFGKLLSGAATFAQNFGSKISSIASSAASTAGDVLKSIGGMASNLISKVLPEGVEFGDGMDLALGGLIVAAVAIAVVEIVKHWRGVLTGLKAIWNAIKTAAITVWDWIKAHLSVVATSIALVILGPIGALVVEIATHWDSVKKDAITAWNAVISFLKTVGHDIVAVFSAAGTWLEDAGKAIIQGLINGIKNMAKTAVDAVKDVGKGIIDGAKDILHIFSPSTDFVEIGQYVVQGLSQGLADSSEAANALNVLATLANKLIVTLHSLVPEFVTVGTQMMLGLGLGISSQAAAVAAEAVSAATGALTAAKSATRTSSPSQDYAELGVNWILGAIQGVHSQAGALKSSVASTVTGALPSAGLGAGRGTGIGSGGLSVTYGNIYITSPTGTTPDLSAALQKALQQNNQQLLTSIRVGAGNVNG